MRFMHSGPAGRVCVLDFAILSTIRQSKDLYRSKRVHKQENPPPFPSYVYYDFCVCDRQTDPFSTYVVIVVVAMASRGSRA